MLAVIGGVLKVFPLPNGFPPVGTLNQYTVSLPDALKVVGVPTHTDRLAVGVVFVGGKSEGEFTFTVNVSGGREEQPFSIVYTS